MLKKFILICLCLLLLCGCDKAPAPAPTEGPAETEVPKAPDFTPNLVFAATDAFGNAVSQENWPDYSLIMLNFWAVWCPPCLKELPDLQKLQEAYAEQGLLLIGVMVDGVVEDALPYIENHGLTYPIIVAAGDLALRCQDMQYVPTTLFVDPFGNELKEVVGANHFEGWMDIVESLLP